MIDCTRLSANEREVLHGALKDYDGHQAGRLRRSELEQVANDVKWRRHVIADLLRQINGK